MRADIETVFDITTPALIVDDAVLTNNFAAMDAVRPGAQLRPHVKAFKSSALAHCLAAEGHRGFCAATPREIEGLVSAGLTDDLLLAKLSDDANITVAVDSDATLAAAIDGGVRAVLIDVEVGLSRCGCDPADAGRLGDQARRGGLEVRGVMGYEAI